METQEDVHFVHYNVVKGRNVLQFRASDCLKRYYNYLRVAKRSFYVLVMLFGMRMRKFEGWLKEKNRERTIDFTIECCTSLLRKVVEEGEKFQTSGRKSYGEKNWGSI